MLWVFLYAGSVPACRGINGYFTGQHLLWDLFTLVFLLQMHVAHSVVGDTSCKVVCCYLEMYSMHCYTISWSGSGRVMVTEVALPSAVWFSVTSELHRCQACFRTHFLCSKGDKNLTRRHKLCLVPHGKCFLGRPHQRWLLPVLSSSHTGQRQKKKLWYMPDCFTHPLS